MALRIQPLLRALTLGLMTFYLLHNDAHAGGEDNMQTLSIDTPLIMAFPKVEQIKGNVLNIKFKSLTDTREHPYTVHISASRDIGNDLKSIQPIGLIAHYPPTKPNEEKTISIIVPQGMLESRDDFQLQFEMHSLDKSKSTSDAALQVLELSF